MVIHRNFLAGELEFTYTMGIQIIWNSKMSTQKLIHTLSSELQHINEEIDLKVIRGIPYKREAKRHKLLMNMLQDVTRIQRPQTSMRFLSFLL